MELTESLLQLLEFNKGKTFYGFYPVSSKNPHICIIINPDHDAEKTMYYVFMTSQKDTIDFFHKYDKAGFATLELHEYEKFFRKEDLKPTFISCRKDAIHELSQEELKRDILEKISELKEMVDDSVLKKIEQAIINTVTLTHDEKEEILGKIIKQQDQGK